MAEPSESSEPPTYYANFVSLSVDPDVAYIELRRYIKPHVDMYRDAQRPAPPPTQATPPTAETVYSQSPIARVVLTYTSAKALLNLLNEMIPKMELARKGS